VKYFHPRLQNVDTVGDLKAFEEALDAVIDSLKRKEKESRTLLPEDTPDTILIQVTHQGTTKYGSYSYNSTNFFGRPVTFKVKKEATIGEVKEIMRRRLIAVSCWKGDAGDGGEGGKN
jgi:hypothetical protein